MKMVLHYIVLILVHPMCITSFIWSFFNRLSLGKRQELLAETWKMFGLGYRKICSQVMNDDTGRLFYFSFILCLQILWGLDRKYGNIQYHSRSLINDNATTRLLAHAVFGRLWLDTR
jgi:hypothetical protein